jgi:hypothetical protein
VSPGMAGPVAGILARVRRHLHLLIGGALGLSLVAVVGAVLVLAWFLAGPGGWVPGTRIPLALLVLGGAAGAATGGWLLVRTLAWTGERALSAEVEDAAGVPRGAVRSRVELSRALPPGVSPSLARAGEEALASRLSGPPGRLAGRAGREAAIHLRVAGVGAGVLLATAALLLLLSPERARTAWAGLGHAGVLAVPTPLPPLEIHPGDVELPRGEVPEVRVRAEARDSVTVHWQAVGEPVRSRGVGIAGGEGALRLPPLDVPVTYWASAPDGARTGEHRFTPVDPALVTDLVLEVHHPPHTRLPPEVHRGSAPPLILPAGSEIRVRGGVVGSAAGPWEGAVLLRDDDAPDRVLARFPLYQGAFQGSWRPVRSGVALWGMEEQGVEVEGVLPRPLEVEVVPDRPPTVSLHIPGRDMELPLSLRMPLLLEAEDDWGVAWVELEAVRLSPDGEPGVPVVDRIPGSDRRRLMLRPLLDVSEWGVRPGDVVELRARAGDNAPMAGIAETPAFRLTVPDAPRVRELARERIREAAERAGELARGAGESARELDALEVGRGFEGREELREILEARELAAREVEALREGLKEAREALGREGEDASLRDRLEELERLLDQALGRDERERIRDLLDRLREGEYAPDVRTLDELARDQERFRERLDEALERLRRSAMEAAFEGVEEEAGRVAEAQEALVPDLAQARGAEEQEALAERVRSLEERVEALAGELARDATESVREALARSAQDLSRTREAMAAAAGEVRDGDGERASARGDEASREAREAAESLEEARREWMEEWMEEVREALRRAAQDALSLARRQGEIRERMQGAGPLLRRDLQGELAAVSMGLRNLAVAASLATRASPDLGREISRALGEAMAGIEEAVEGMGGGGGPRAAPYVAAGGALEATNRAALAALAGLRSLGEDGGGGGMEELLRELEALAARQQSLNQEAASLSLEPDAPGGEGRMEELAAGQEAVAGGVEALSGTPGAEGAMGDLEELAREARELAGELEGGRLDAETLERQERLLERLLSAGRTLEREGETDEREGTPAGETERRVVAPLSPELLRSLAFPPPSPEELEALSPGERRLVLEYFERMNRRRAGGGGP